ncbi:GNAT family N-acetyltransferase [Cryobacterium sp. 1639]|uniref:GNAT family N-acetyltransferase n=1 Tax=Cryobacterium inferilacus TaxID=2866629 RepID=UPI001C72CAB0|nr:GNAT family N-acetyltransferase [Cryobacterium sp. 1639]MBX0300439.1 GNAT family N-acetyltransferase [Cryobacterium sp. 1639]
MLRTKSLGFRTDLMLLALQGSTITRQADFLVVTTPTNPDFHWGNFVLLDRPPATGTAASWAEQFGRSFPGAPHLSIGVDGTDGAAGEPTDLAEAQLEVDRSIVLTRSEHAPIRPSRPTPGVTFRRLDVADDSDWAQAVALRRSNAADIPGYAEFTRQRVDAMRALQRAQHGSWFGAFLDGHMVSGLGIFSDGTGTARYQSVDTHPEFRRRGFAGALVHAAGRYAIDHLAATTLVIVADPDDSAIRLYRALGFTGTEIQTQLERVAP